LSFQLTGHANIASLTPAPRPGKVQHGRAAAHHPRRTHRQPHIFVTLHETGHETLPWQRNTYAFLEDCEESLDLDLKNQFEREANVFASEVLFQGDRFGLEADGLPFSINSPIALSKMFGASSQVWLTVDTRQ